MVTEANTESLICQIESEPLQGCVLDDITKQCVVLLSIVDPPCALIKIIIRLYFCNFLISS